MLKKAAVQEYIELLKEVEARGKALAMQALKDMDEFTSEGETFNAVAASAYAFHIVGMHAKRTIEDLGGMIK